MPDRLRFYTKIIFRCKCRIWHRMPHKLRR